MMSSADSSFTTALRTFGFIETISRFNGNNYSKKESSLEDYVGKITALFSPYLPESISERDFSALQKELRSVLAEIKKN